MKKWYNCWLIHAWGIWSSPNEFGWTYLRQQRICHLCGKGEARVYHA